MRSFSRALFSVWLLAGLFLTAGCASLGLYTNYEMKTDYVGKESYNAELFENNYREVINKEPVSIVVYYRNNRPGMEEMSEFIYELKKNIDAKIPIYKVDCQKFKQASELQSIVRDVFANTVPAIALYKKGGCLTQGVGYPQKEKYQAWINAIKEKL